MTPNVEVVPFSPEHLGPASELLAARQHRLRTVRPELRAAYEQADVCAVLLSALLAHGESHGVVAHTTDGVVGYLLGYPRYEPIWGRACWSPIEGQAYDPSIGSDVMRDIFAVWSRHFVDRGFFRQYVYAPADDPAVLDTWFLTGFGKMQAQALRDLDLEAPSRISFTIRRVVAEDLDFIEPLLPLIPMGLVKSPAYAISLPEWYGELRGEYAEELANAASMYWLAEENGHAIGLAGFAVGEPGVMVPEGAWYLQDAKTAPSARGRGVMRALVATAFAEARAAGATYCLTDWRTASLPAHRTWTALGFRPTDFRLHRQIDERIAWASGPPG